MPRLSDYQLSRIYAEGWRAAISLTPAQTALLESGGIAALNPHREARARMRWSEGFGRARGDGAPRHAGASARWDR
ncbi:MAG: hypothetical protein JSR60_20280 [Proteobacteria bacterium]|nr:hypothetical protein [Pseudomonadota bacterium]